MTYYLKNGNMYSVTDELSMDLCQHLPAANYIIQVHPMTGQFLLERVESFKMIPKIYGTTPRYVERIFNTFDDRENSTGVLLNGEKGSGKTQLAKLLSIKCAQENIPTIIINQPWHGDSFNKFIQTIEQPCMIMFDEFEKVYDSEQQESILTLLDGVFPSKKLFVLTCNDKWRIDSHMRNRPGRIFYMLDFTGLDDAFIREYCEDNLKNKQHIDKICMIASLFGQFNFDMLKALVEEMNRYGETPSEALLMLNSKPEFEDRGEHELTLIINGEAIDSKAIWPSTWKGNPLKDDIVIRHTKRQRLIAVNEVAVQSDDVYDEPEENEDVYRFDAGLLTNIDSANKTYTFRNSRGMTLIVKRKVQTYNSNYMDLF